MDETTFFDWAVQATVEHKDEVTGAIRTVQLPTFILAGRVQGIKNREHAHTIAVAIIDPLRTYNTVTTSLVPVLQ